MEIAHPDTGFLHIFGEVFRHAFGQGCDQHALALEGTFAAFRHDIIDLVFDRTDNTDRIDQPGGADDLLNKGTAGAFQLPGPRCGRDKHGLRSHAFPFLEFEGAVIDAARQPKTKF